MRQKLAAVRAGDVDLVDGDDGSGAAGAAVDEEAEREAWFLQLDLYATKV